MQEEGISSGPGEVSGEVSESSCGFFLLALSTSWHRNCQVEFDCIGNEGVSSGKGSVEEAPLT